MAHADLQPQNWTNLLLGRKGMDINMVIEEDRWMLWDIETFYKTSIKEVVLNVLN